MVVNLVGKPSEHVGIPFSKLKIFFHVILCIFGYELLVELSCRKMKNCVNVVYGDGMNWGVVWV